MAGYRLQQLVLVTSLLLLLIYQCQSRCNYEILSRRSCYFVQRFVQENINRDDYSLISESSLNAVEDSERSQECRKACQAINGAEFWEYAKRRLEKEWPQLKNSTVGCKQLQDDLDLLSSRQAKQLSSLRRIRGVYQKCQAEKSRLTEEAAKLSSAVDNIQYGYQVALSKLNIRSLQMSILEKKHGDCKERISGLSQAPEFEDPSTIQARVAELEKLKIQMAELTERTSTQQAMVNSLKQENELLKATNAELHEATSEKLAKSDTKYANCREEVQRWQRKLEQSDVPARAGDRFTNTSSNCRGRFTSDFCSFEVTDLTHKEACWFERMEPLDYNWRVVSNLKEGILDHTCSSARGRFMFIDLSKVSREQPARLTSVLLQATTKQCFSFWYNVGYTFNYGQFYIQVLEKRPTNGRRGDGLRIWEQNLGREDEWQFANFEIPSYVAHDGYRIELTAASNGPGYVALDDLGLTMGPCPR